jgi:ubiquinone/menaquinone biosynthesis C-methylase UbiE
MTRLYRACDDDDAMAQSFLTDGAHYDAAHSYRVEDLAFWTSLVTPGTRVLELACGTGRIAIPLARAGAIVTALDAAPSMLARAREKSADVTWIEGDMRAFDVARDQDLAILGFNAINLLDVDDALECLRRVREHLRPGGRLAIETFLALPRKLVDSTTDEQISAYKLDGVDYRVTAKRTYDPARQRRRLELRIHRSDRTELEHDAFDFHIYFPSELRLLVERAGFTITDTFGGYDRSPLTATSKQCIVMGSG